MNTLQAAVAVVLVVDDIALCIASLPVPLVCPCQSEDALVCDVAAFDQTDTLQFGQRSKACDRVVRQVHAAAEINVPYTVAAVHQPFNSLVGDLGAVAQVYIVQVLAQPRDRVNGGVGDVTALGENKVTQARCHGDDPVDGLVRESNARCQVEDAKVLVHPFGRQVQEGGITDELAASQPQLTQGLAFSHELCDGFVCDESALMKIYFKNVGAVRRKGTDRVVRQL